MRHPARLVELSVLETLSACCWRREVIRQRSGARPAEEQPCLLRRAFARDRIQDASGDTAGLMMETTRVGDSDNLAAMLG